jgi:hypothetical protein
MAESSEQSGKEDEAMWDRLKPGPHYEQLSQAIIHAILSSEEVQERVADLHRQGALDGDDIIALALRFPPHGGLEAKVELMRKPDAERAELEDDEEAEEESSPRPPSVKKSGRPRTPNEIAFEKYLVDRFNEEAWMKNAGIRFLDKGETNPQEEEFSSEEETK